MKAAQLTQERLRELLHYDPETGLFRWLVSPVNSVKAGTEAGGINSHERRQIQIDGRKYGANRLAWFYMTGEWPAEEVDHDNLIKDDNSWDNLREATRAENQMNIRRHRDNTSGVKGVSWDASKSRWDARIGINGRRIYLGLFTDLDEAAAAYATASERLHGKFGRTE